MYVESIFSCYDIIGVRGSSLHVARDSSTSVMKEVSVGAKLRGTILVPRLTRGNEAIEAQLSIKKHIMKLTKAQEA